MALCPFRPGIHAGLAKRQMAPLLSLVHEASRSTALATPAGSGCRNRKARNRA